MKNLILAASVAAFAFAAPAYAGPGKGNQGHKANHGQKAAHAHKKGNVGVLGHAGHQPYGYGVNGCPPGLAKKPMCMPPGQYKKQFEVGQRLPLGQRGLLGYNALPYDMRARYGDMLDPRSRYMYDNAYLYRVDPKTMLVQQVLSALIR